MTMEELTKFKKEHGDEAFKKLRSLQVSMYENEKKKKNDEIKILRETIKEIKNFLTDDEIEKQNKK